MKNYERYPVGWCLCNFDTTRLMRAGWQLAEDVPEPVLPIELPLEVVPPRRYDEPPFSDEPVVVPGR